MAGVAVDAAEGLHGRDPFAVSQHPDLCRDAVDVLLSDEPRSRVQGVGIAQVCEKPLLIEFAILRQVPLHNMFPFRFHYTASPTLDPAPAYAPEPQRGGDGIPYGLHRALSAVE